MDNVKRHFDKSIITANRKRKITGGFGWIEHRFLREGYIEMINKREMLLYFFLALVSDKNGISFYGPQRTMSILKLEEAGYFGALAGLEQKDFIFSLRAQKANKWKNWIQHVSLELVRKHGFLPGKRSFMLLGLEGDKEEIKYQRKKINKILTDFKTFSLGEDTAQTWYRHRFENPYLRDVLLDYDILMDTLETSTEWNNVKPLYSTVKTAILSTFHKLKIKGVVTAHLSHLYPTGCSLYFILIATPVVGKELETWKALKTAASNAIIKAGGSISHHHGVGLDHRAWIKQDIGDTSVELLRNLKKHVDPQNILNPKKLLPDSDLRVDTFLEKQASAEESLSFSPAVRADNISKLQTEQFDILVIGGGITGAGIIRDAVFRGYRTALIEKNDFASGTSSKSSKMIHGGFRYLKNLAIGLVNEALRERKILMDLAPHLVHPMPPVPGLMNCEMHYLKISSAIYAPQKEFTCLYTGNICP